MKNTRLLLTVSFCLTLAQLRGEIVYDNSENPEGKFNNSTLESGDQVRLAGESRIITEFAFEYFASFTAQGDETARVRFYSNDGADLEGLKTPGTLLYDSGSFTIASGYRTIRGSELELFVNADTFTWTIEFG